MPTHPELLYKPLPGDKTTRFIKLLPGASTDPIALDMVSASLAAEPSPIYEATSYTWGAPTPTHTILCNGEQFELRENAYHFLLQLRQPRESRTLWMDCVCINQSDMQERAEQVKIMHLIYRQARTVLVWLGTSDAYSTIAMDYISRLDPKPLVKEVRHDADRPKGWPTVEGKAFLFDRLPESDESRALVDALCGLFSRPWFRRIWVQQEASLCKDTVVLCGAQHVVWDQMLAMAWLLIPRVSRGWPEWTQGSTFEAIEPSLLATRRIQTSRFTHLRVPDHELRHDAHQMIVQEGGLCETFAEGAGSFPHASFVALATTCSFCEATDCRDKVYALLSLATNLQYTRNIIDVDYTVPWQTVFIRAAKCMYELRPSVTLESAGRSFQDGVHIPSWVPDLRIGLHSPFSRQVNTSAAYGSPFRFLGLPRSRSGQPSIPTYSYEDNQGRKRRLPNEGLEITVILQDRIVYSSPKLHSNPGSLRYDASGIRHKLSTDRIYLREHLPKYFTGDPGMEAYAGTIIANTNHDDSVSSKKYEVDGFAEWQAWLENGMPDPDPGYHEAVENAGTPTRNIFNITGHGLMCLAPAMATTGDYIALLQGFQCGIALRRVGTSDQQYYELLGACYVHRLMRGRAASLIEEFKCKYRKGSEDEVPDSPLTLEPIDVDESVCETFPFNAKSDYRNVVRVLGKRKIILV